MFTVYWDPVRKGEVPERFPMWRFAALTREECLAYITGAREWGDDLDDRGQFTIEEK